MTFTLVFFLSGIGRLGAGYMLDKADYRLVLAVVAGMLTASMLYLQFVTVTTIALAMPFVTLFGVGFGSVIPTRGTLGTMMFGTRSLGSIVGLLQGGSVAAGVIGPIFMARVFDVTGRLSRGHLGACVHRSADDSDRAGDGVAQAFERTGPARGAAGICRSPR